MENSIEKNASCQFDMDIPAYALAYMDEEQISPDEIRQVLVKALSKFEIPQSDSRRFFRSKSSDLGIMCKCPRSRKEKLDVNIIFAFRLSAAELNFTYNGKKVRIFYDENVCAPVSSNEKCTQKNKFDPSDGFITVLAHLDELTATDKDEDLILKDVITLCLWRHMKEDVLQLEIIAAPLAVHNID